MVTATIQKWKPFSQHPQAQEIINGLDMVPDSWALTPVIEKRPYRDEWQTEYPCFKEHIRQCILNGENVWSEKKQKHWHGYASGYGLRLGDISGGLIAIDVDGSSVQELLNAISEGNLPNTPMWSSGKPGRYQVLFQIPDEYRDKLKEFGKRSYTTWNGYHCKEGEQLELRYNNHQSVLPCSYHPETGQYEWLVSPEDAEVATAPDWVIRLALGDLRDPARSTPEINYNKSQHPNTDEEWAREYLNALSPFRADNYEDWVKVGQCLHSVSDNLLADWDEWSSRSPKYKEGECEKKWKSFKPHKGLTIATLGAMAKEDGWQPKSKQSQSNQPPNDRSTAGEEEDDDDKPVKLNDKKLLRYIRNHLNLRYNEMTRELEVDGKVLNCEPYLYLLDKHNLGCGKDKAVDLMMMVGKENAYNPVKEYLEKVRKEVDPIDISNLSKRYFGTSNPLYDLFIKKTLIGAVARSYNPGCKLDTALVLQGEQGIGKSTFLEVLGGEYFDNSMGSGSDKDDLLTLHRSWVQEWGELDRILGKKHAGEIKQFLSKSQDSFREPYARKSERFLRRGIIVGSVNQNEFLNDPTGGRRFWVVPVATDDVDIPTLKKERDAIWAGAVQAYRAGQSWWLTKEEERQNTENNEQFRNQDEWEIDIEEYLNDRTQVSVSEILTDVFQYQPKDIHIRDKTRVTNCLKVLGWNKGSRKLYKGKRQVVWEKVFPTSVAPVASNSETPSHQGIQSEATDGSDDSLSMASVASNSSPPDQEATDGTDGTDGIISSGSSGSPISQESQREATDGTEISQTFPNIRKDDVTDQEFKVGDILTMRHLSGQKYKATITEIEPGNKYLGIRFQDESGRSGITRSNSPSVISVADQWGNVKWQRE